MSTPSALADGDTVEADFREPLEELRDALQNPDKPPERVRQAVDRLKGRFESWDLFEADCRTRFAGLQRQIDQLAEAVDGHDEDLAEVRRDVAEVKDRPVPDVEIVRETIQRETIRPVVPATPAGEAQAGHGGCIWNVPAATVYFTGRQTILDKIHEALTSGATAAALTQPRAIHGLGGVGKTQVARRYAWLHGDEYEIGWWVRAEDRPQLLADLVELARRMGLPCKDDPNLPGVAQEVLAELQRRDRWLLIFDNVPNPDALRDLVPAGGHVLITTRWANWPTLARPIPVTTFPRPESIRFLKERRVDDGDEQALDDLAEELGDLPLALSLASSYMVRCGKTPADYLALFRENSKSILAEQKPPRGYDHNVTTTWDMSIREVKQGNPEAAELLELLAFFAPDDIARRMIAEGSEDLSTRLGRAVRDEMRFDKCIAALKGFSLVEASDAHISVHRLLQTVVRQRLRSDTLARRAMEALNVVNRAFPFDADDVTTWHQAEPFYPHARSAIERVITADRPEEPTGRLLNQCGLYLHARAEFAEARVCFELALRIDETAFGPEPPNVATVVSNLGLVLRALGDLAGAKECYERAQRINEVAFGSNHPEVATDVNNLGSVLQALGDLAGAKECYERAQRIDEVAFGSDHLEVATDVNNLGSVLQDLGDMTAAKECYERALLIDETAFGPDHPTVAIRVNNLGSVL